MAYFRDDRASRAQAIDGRGDDAAGVARPFADRVQPGNARRLARSRRRDRCAPANCRGPRGRRESRRRRKRPCQRRSICGRPCATAVGHHRRQHFAQDRTDVTPRGIAGLRDTRRRSASGEKSFARCAGRAYSPRPPISNAFASYCSWKCMPASDVGAAELLRRVSSPPGRCWRTGESRLEQAHAVRAEVARLARRWA